MEIKGLIWIADRSTKKKRVGETSKLLIQLLGTTKAKKKLTQDLQLELYPSQN